MASSSPYQYILSLPERVVRSLGALSGGLLREIGEVVVPARLRRTTLYRTMVEVTLRFLIEEVGQVDGVYPSENHLAENFLVQRTASHGIELLGILTLHASPVWVLAALADATGAGKQSHSRTYPQSMRVRLPDANLRACDSFVTPSKA